MVSLVRLSQVSDSTEPLNQWPRGQRILALSTGPSDDWTAYLCSISAGSPHLSAPCLSIYAGQSIKITSVFTAAPIRSMPGGTAPAGHLAAQAPRAATSSYGEEHSLTHLIHPPCRLAVRAARSSGLRVGSCRTGVALLARFFLQVHEPVAVRVGEEEHWRRAVEVHDLVVVKLRARLAKSRVGGLGAGRAQPYGHRDFAVRRQ